MSGWEFATEYRRTGPGWETQKLLRRISENVDYFFQRNNQTMGDWLPDWQIPAWLLELVFWLITVGVSAWALWQLGRLVWPWVQRWGLGASAFVTVGTETPPPQESVEEWVRRSRTAYQQGNYGEACRALYQAALQTLNDRALIRQQASRTDGEYLALLEPMPRSRSYQTLVQTHEQVCFGDRPITAETYEACWQAWQEIAPS